MLAFVTDTADNKRAKLIDELLAEPRMDRQVDHVLRRPLPERRQTSRAPACAAFPQGRNAFYQWIHDSLAANKPYNQMATELISAADDEHLHRRRRNWILNGYITGGPAQDIMDQSRVVRLRHVPGHRARQLRPVPQRPRPPRSAQPVGRATHPLPGLAARAYLSRTTVHAHAVDPASNNSLLLDASRTTPAPPITR